jgi:peptide/nickel transport system permease protein
MSTAVDTADSLVEPERLRRPTFRRRALRSRSLVAGVILTGVIALSAILAPVLSPDSPEHQDLYHILSGMSAAHPLGTDQLGRDELSRLLYAGRTDLEVGVLAIIFPLVFGTLVGTVAGYYRGIADEIISRAIDIVIAFPFLVLVIGLVFVVGPGTRGIYIAFAIADWIVYARAVRATTLIVRESDYVAAARAGGLGNARILWSHVLPNTITQAIVYAMTDVVLVIVAVVTLGYVGLGVQPPDFDWGSMINDGQEFLTTNWTLATIPGLAVVLTGLGLSLIGDGLADVLRPQ